MLAALALGAASVTVAGDDDEMLAVAEGLGASACHTDFDDRPGRRWPIVVDCGLRPEALQWAIRATEPEGTLHSVSYYGDAPTVSMPLGRLYALGISFHIGRAHSASLLPEVAALVGQCRLRPELVPTTVVDWAEAAERYLDPALKLVVLRPPNVRAA